MSMAIFSIAIYVCLPEDTGFMKPIFSLNSQSSSHFTMAFQRRQFKGAPCQLLRQLSGSVGQRGIFAWDYGTLGEDLVYGRYKSIAYL